MTALYVIATAALLCVVTWLYVTADRPSCWRSHVDHLVRLAVMAITLYGLVRVAYGWQPGLSAMLMSVGGAIWIGMRAIHAR